MASRWITITLVLGLMLLVLGARDDIRRTLQATKPAAKQTASSYDRANVSFSDVEIIALVPRTGALQSKGLAGRTHLTDKEGMLWLYPASDYPSFWMKGMTIPIDILWINGQVVVDRSLDVQPPTPAHPALPIIRPNQPADTVLEVAAGFAVRHQIEVGDQVLIDPAP